MTWTVWRTWAAAVVVAAAVAYLGWSGDKPVQAALADPDKGDKYLGSGECRGCHIRRTGNRDEDFCLLTEYATWALSDRHALAYIALEGPRGRRIGSLLGIDVTKDASCLACHAVASLDKIEGGKNLVAKEGVGCEGCHGAAAGAGGRKPWLANHVDRPWRELTAEDKEKAGLNDLRNPIRRAEVCLSCHLGDPAQGRVVTHAMYAAGHPPLKGFEVTSACERMPRHWRLKADVPFLKKAAADGKKDVVEKYHFNSAGSTHAQGAVGTGLASFALQTRLAADRANATPAWSETQLPGFKGLGEDELWPQVAMAHSDCTACHHELRRSSWRPARGFEGWTPGRPQLPYWPLTLARAGVGANPSKVNAALAEISAACNDEPFGDRKKLAAAAAKGPTAVLPEDWRTAAFAPEANPALLRSLAALPEGMKYVDFDSAREIVAALSAAYGDYVRTKGEKANPEIEQILTTWKDKLGLNIDADALKQRREIMLQTLGKGNTLSANPAAYQALDYLAQHGFVELSNYPKETGGQPAKDKEKIAATGKTIVESLENLAGVLPLVDPLLPTKDGGPPPALALKMIAVNEALTRAVLTKARDYDAFLFAEDLKRLSKLLPTP